jgi:hypothetical protein
MLADRGIITLCDENYFPGLLMLHRSVQESQPCMVACYDLGMTREQRVVAAGRSNLEILPLPEDSIIDRIKVAMSLTPPLAKLHKRVWPLWICPVLIKHAPFRDVIWMDCDLVVLRNLADLFAAIETGPLFTPENKAPQFTANHPELYDLMPIRRSFDSKLPTVNAGVSGWRKPRDAAAIDAYLLPVERAIVDKNVRDAIAWHDQGALIWAIQSCSLEHRVASTTSWNLCVDNTPIVHRSIPWDDDFLSVVRAEVPAAHIVHWNGNEPPWNARRLNDG